MLYSHLNSHANTGDFVAYLTKRKTFVNVLTKSIFAFVSRAYDAVVTLFGRSARGVDVARTSVRVAGVTILTCVGVRTHSIFAFVISAFYAVVTLCGRSAKLFAHILFQVACLSSWANVAVLANSFIVALVLRATNAVDTICVLRATLLANTLFRVAYCTIQTCVSVYTSSFHAGVFCATCVVITI